VPPGLNVKLFSNVKEKEANLTVILWQIKKLPHHASQLSSIIKREIHDAKMWIIGDGYFRKKLESFETKDVMLYGYVPN
jgi:hypothetical protein